MRPMPMRQDYICENRSVAACCRILATSTNVVVLNNIFDQQTLSTRPWTVPASLEAEEYGSWQIAYPIRIRQKAGDFNLATATSSTTS